jgi:hypothetical protein
MTPRSVAQRTADADTLDRWLRQQRPADALTGDLLAGPLADPGRHARDPGAEAGQAGARALARQLREVAEQRHAVAAARAGRSRACPFVDGGRNPRINGDRQKAGTELAAKPPVRKGWVVGPCQRRKPPKASVYGGLPPRHSRKRRSVVICLRPARPGTVGHP